jgi:LysM repeat protein
MKKKEKVIEEVIEDAKIEENASKEKEDAKVPEYYTLRIGETLKDVAKKFGVDEEKLKQLNGEVVGTNQIKVK